MKKLRKFLIKFFIMIAVGTGITFGILKAVDHWLYKISQSSYLEVETYRTGGEVTLKDEDIIEIPDGAEQLQFSYNNKYYDSIFNYWEDCSMCGFTQDNILYVSDSIYPSNVDGLNLRCAISFGPALIINGQPRIYGAYGWGVQPRTCIAQRQDGAVLFLVIDGRQADSYGATLKQAQDILLNYGAYNAFNLDGGASSTMVFDGNVVNKPSDIAGERNVPTAFIVK